MYEIIMFFITLIVLVVGSTFLLYFANERANKNTIREEKFCFACGKEYQGEILCNGTLTADVIHKDYDRLTGEKRFWLAGSREYDWFSCYFKCMKCGESWYVSCYGLASITLYSRQLVNGRFVLEGERCPAIWRRCCNARVDNTAGFHVHSDDVPCAHWVPY